MRKDAIENLALYAHKAWSGWMDYVFTVSKQNEDGSVTIPSDRVARWKRQIETPYCVLSEDEKESDRCEAREMLRIIKNGDNL